MATVVANFNKKMNALRIEADENQAKAEELQTKVKGLEQENLTKEQEITSLTHRNQLLEAEVEKLETSIKEAKSLAGESAQHGQQNEALTRRLQLLEEEAEEADKTLRETNEKYAHCLASAFTALILILLVIDFVRRTSKLATTNAKSKLWSSLEISGRPSTKRCPRSTQTCRRSCTSWKLAWATSRGFQSPSHTRP
jgi:DNA repair ATPase RecN